MANNSPSMTAQRYYGYGYGTGKTKQQLIDEANAAVAPAAPAAPAINNRTYVDTASKGAPGAILLSDAVNQSTDKQSGGGIGGAGNSSGVLADSQPLGNIIDDENRYTRRSGAVLLR